MTYKSIYIPNTFSRFTTLKDKWGGIGYDDLNVSLNRSYSRKMTITTIGKNCIVCGRTRSLEIHHVKHLRHGNQNLAVRNWFLAQIAAINRKQVPLCSIHHHALHNNTLSHSEKEAFRSGCKSLVPGINKK